jgi:hypothetical protein
VIPHQGGWWRLTAAEAQAGVLLVAWKSEETGEELNRMLQETRHTEQRDIEL